MNNKTFWIGFVVVFVVQQALGFIIHAILMSDTYAALGSVLRPEAEMMDMMWMMMVGEATMMYMFCFIFTKGYEGTGIMEGVRFGVLIAFLVAGAVSISPHVVFPLPADVASIWLISSFGTFIVAGALFAAIYKPAAAA